MTSAWRSMRHVFAVCRSLFGPPLSHLGALVIKKFPHFPIDVLWKHPVDLLVVECCSRTKPPRKGDDSEHWEKAVTKTRINCRPKVVLESWNIRCNTWNNSPTSKGSTTRCNKLGYNTRVKFVSCAEVGGSVEQYCIMIARVQTAHASKWSWPSTSENVPRRPMSNLLTPSGLIHERSYIDAPCGIIFDASADPMPPHPGSMIRTDRGVRQLQTDKFGRGLGFLNSDSKLISSKLAKQTTSVYHWEYLSPIFTEAVTETLTPSSSETIPVIDLITSSSIDTPPSFDFAWRPPDLSIDGAWYKERISNLHRASMQYNNSEEVYEDGLLRLERHRKNYDDEGPNPTFLQLFWWEFPPEHWEELREGFRMNFLREPPCNITPNAAIDESGLEAAREFVDKLILLGVFREIDEGMRVLSNAPLFVVPKPGQPGQWRCIADMRAGGQNDCIGPDPCFLPRTGHILE